MTPPQWLEVYIVAVVHIGTVIVFGAVIDYNRSRWTATEVGKAQMTKWLSLLALFVLSVANYWWPFGAAFWWIYAVVLTVVDAALLWQWAVMRRVQRRG